MRALVKLFLAGLLTLLPFAAAKAVVAYPDLRDAKVFDLKFGTNTTAISELNEMTLNDAANYHNTTGDNLKLIIEGPLHCAENRYCKSGMEILSPEDIWAMRVQGVVGQLMTRGISNATIHTYAQRAGRVIDLEPYHRDHESSIVALILRKN